MRCGTVIFDEQEPASGWASIEGEQAFRIRGLGDLRSDVFWWTNLEYANFNYCGLAKSSNMRNQDYLRTPMTSLMDELGITSRFIQVNEAICVLSEIFSRVMNLAEENYGLTQSTAMRFSDDLRALVLPEDELVSHELDKACQTAYQTFVKCTRSPARVKTRSIQFKRNRYLHAMDVLMTPVPTGGFEYIPKNKMPPAAERVSWLLKEQRPVLVNGVVTSVSPEFANVIAFGGGALNRRSWISHPELMVMASFGRLEIESAFLFDAYEPLQLNMQAPTVNPGLGMLSISIGLLAENFWVGLASPQTNRHDYSRKVYAPRATWLRASDRAFTMIPAMRVHENGIQVSSYGVGSVTIDVPVGNLQEVIEVAGAAGLYPPLTVPEDAAIQGDLA